MVSRTLFLFICSILFCMPLVAFSQSDISENDSELIISLSRTDIQLGQFFRVTLHYNGPQKLASLNMSAWRNNFRVISINEYQQDDENNPGRIIQVLKLRLYPRNIGEQIIPPLKLGSLVSQSHNVRVVQANINHSPVQLSWEISTLSPWQRQAVIVRVHIQSAEASAHVILDSVEADSDTKTNVLLRPLMTFKQVLSNDTIAFDAGWILYPLNAENNIVDNDGDLEIDLPAIRYQISGSDRRVFYLPLQHLKIKALPSYFSPLTPVGKLNIQSQLVRSDETQWQISINTSALIPFGVAGVDRQLEKISGYDISRIKMQYSQVSDYENYADNIMLESPLPDWMAPFGNDINLTLRYFNPQTGRLENVVHHLPRSWNMPLWAWWLVIIIFFFVSFILVIKIISPVIVRFQARLKLHRQLKLAVTHEQLRYLILASASMQTLSEWAGHNIERQDIANKLNRSCFSNISDVDIKLLKHELIRLS